MSIASVAALPPATALADSAAGPRQPPIRTLPAVFGSGLASRARYAVGGRRLPVSFAEGGAVGNAFVTEDTTNVKFPQELTVPGYPEPLVVLGTGYREKLFVKVYAAAFYMDQSISVDVEKWRKKVGIESFDASSVFDSIFKALIVKSLCIFLVRDVDGKTFVKALDDVITCRIKNPTAEEESALSTFQNTFLGHNLKKGTGIYLTWLEPSRMLISISADEGPRQVDAEIKSANVNSALYDGFFGNSPVSPSLRSSTAQLLEAILYQK